MRGRKRTPSAKRAIDGNAGRRPLNDAEPQPPPLAEVTGDIPPELAGNPRAIAEWSRVLPLMKPWLSAADRGALVALCLEWARYLDATEKTERLGLVVTTKSGYPMTNPYLSIATKALSMCSKLWPELGLTPSSRTRVHTLPPEADAFAEFDEPPRVLLPSSSDETTH